MLRESLAVIRNACPCWSQARDDIKSAVSHYLLGKVQAHQHSPHSWHWEPESRTDAAIKAKWRNQNVSQMMLKQRGHSHEGNHRIMIPNTCMGTKSSIMSRKILENYKKAFEVEKREVLPWADPEGLHRWSPDIFSPRSDDGSPQETRTGKQVRLETIATKIVVVKCRIIICVITGTMRWTQNNTWPELKHF